MTQSAVASHPHPEPRSYSQMLLTWTYRPWKPVAGLVCVLAGILLVMPLVLIPVLMVALWVQGDSITDSLEPAVSLTKVTPAAMLYLNLTLASMTVVVFAIMRWIHRMRPRWATSVKPGVRWKFLAACFGLSVVALAAQLLLSSVLPNDVAGMDGQLHSVTRRTVEFGLVFLFTTPLQAIGEEYAFRGYAMQAFGALTKRPWFAILLSAVLFALAHGAQNVPLFFDRFSFGLLAGYLVHATGGLEAGIALHILNNLVAFGLGLAYGDVGDLLTTSDVSWWQIPVTITQNGVYLVLVLLVARRLGVGRVTEPPPVLVDVGEVR